MAYLMLSAMLFMLNFSPQEVAHREILLVAQRMDDPDLLIQKKILQADEEGLTERDIIITLITPESDKKRFDLSKRTVYCLFKTKKSFTNFQS